MLRSAAALLSLLLIAAPGATAAETAPKAGSAELVTKATSALNAWKYERAAKAIQDLEKSDPGNASLPLLKLRLAVRIGRFADAAALATKMPAETAKQLSAEEGLKAGRALSAIGKTKVAREWILHAARQAGAIGADRYIDSLIALVAPRGGQGLVTRQFAADLASPVKDRLEAAKAYNVAAQALQKAPRKDFCLRLASYAAQRRLAELSDIAVPEIPGDIGPHLAMAWQAPVGVDEIPEHFALAAGRLLVASQPGGRALPNMPLLSRARAYNLKTGKTTWSVGFAPERGPATQEGTAYSSRIDGMVADAKRAYVLVKTNITRRRGASTEQAESSAVLHAISLTDGKSIWRASIARRSTRLHLAGSHVVATGFRTLAAYETSKGRQACAKEFPLTLSGTAAAVKKGLVLPGWKEIICIDPATGNVAWRAPRPGGAGYVRQCFTGGDSIVLGEKGTGIHGMSSYDATTGKRKWSRSFMAASSGSDELVLALSGGTLVAARGSALRAVAAGSGKNAWKAALPLPGGSSRCSLLGEPTRVLWCSGAELVQLAGSTGTPLWWGSNVQPGLQPVATVNSPAGSMIYTLEGSSPRLLTAWRVRPPSSPIGRQLQAGAAQLISIANRIAAKGNRRAALSLLEIARTYAAPGVLDVDWAIFKLEVAGDGKSPSLESRGLLRAALAKAGGTTDIKKATALFSSLLDHPQAHPGSKCIAAAALMILGDKRGRKHLAKHPSAWSESKERRASILAACRIAGRDATAVLLAGLKSKDGRVRLALVEKLAGYHGKEIETALATRLTDPSREVRVAAANGMVSIMGKRAVDKLTSAYKRERDFFTRNRLRALLTTLGAPPEPVHVVGPRPTPHPVPHPTPHPTPKPSLTREQALAKAAERGKVLWSKADPKDKLLLWIAVEKKFLLLYNSSDGSLTDYKDFLKMVGRKDLNATGLAYGTDSVWAGTTRGAFIFDRRTRAWGQLVINLDFAMLEAHVEKVEFGNNKLIFTVKDKGRFEQDIKTRKWKKL